MFYVSLAVTIETLITGIFDACELSNEHMSQKVKTKTNSNPKTLPIIFVSNIQSFGKSSKTDKTFETEVILNMNNVDISIFTETWLTDNTKDHLPFHDYTKYHLIRKHFLRSSVSVSIFVKDKIKSQKMKIDVPPHLECLWVSVHPEWLPRNISIIIICGIYYPGSSSTYAPPKDDLILHLTTTTLNLKLKYAKPLFILAGDFNDLAVDEICNACNLHQVVKTNTRNNATLDLIMTNNDNDYYNEPRSLPKIWEWRPFFHLV